MVLTYKPMDSGAGSYFINSELSVADWPGLAPASD